MSAFPIYTNPPKWDPFSTCTSETSPTPSYSTGASTFFTHSPHSSVGTPSSTLSPPSSPNQAAVFSTQSACPGRDDEQSFSSCGYIPPHEGIQAANKRSERIPIRRGYPPPDGGGGDAAAAAYPLAYNHRTSIPQQQQQQRYQRKVEPKRTPLLLSEQVGEKKDSDTDFERHFRGNTANQPSASQLKALFLFSEQYAPAFEHVDQPNGMIEEEEVVDNQLSELPKSDLDKIRQRSAHTRALHLLNVTAAGEKHQNSAAKTISKGNGGGSDSSGVHGGLTMRQAAEASHNARLREKMAMQKANVSNIKRSKHDVADNKRVHSSATPVRKEALAESTRRKRQQHLNDDENPETVNGMKCRLDWERQKWAQAKALKLLNGGLNLIALL